MRTAVPFTRYGASISNSVPSLLVPPSIRTRLPSRAFRPVCFTKMAEPRTNADVSIFTIFPVLTLGASIFRMPFGECVAVVYTSNKTLFSLPPSIFIAAPSTISGALIRSNAPLLCFRPSMLSMDPHVSELSELAHSRLFPSSLVINNADPCLSFSALIFIKSPSVM